MALNPASLIRNGVLPLTIALALYGLSRHNYLFFHGVAELFSIVIGFGIFMLAWNSRKIIDNHYFLVLGIASLFTAALDLLHLFSYKGMGIFQNSGANLPTQLWLASRFLLCGSILAAPLFVRRKIRPWPALALYAVLTAGITASIYLCDLFPTCYSEGVGLTPFKIVGEYAVAAIFFGSIILLRRESKWFAPDILRFLYGAMALSIATELAFTLYTDVYGITNVVGHLFKIAACYLFYKAIIETGFVQPYNLLFTSLKQQEMVLLQSNVDLEERVRERTSELAESNEALRREIEERALVEEKLRDSRRISERIADTSPNILYLYDIAERKNIYANRQLTGILGYTPEEVKGTEFYQKMLHPEDLDYLPELRAKWLETQNGHATESTFRMRHANGEWRWLQCRDTVFTRADDGRPLMILGAAQDITEQRLAEEENRSLQQQLLQAQKLDSLGKLAGGVAHDFNNLISAVVGFGELLVDALPPGDEREYAQIICNTGERATELTRQLLAFSRKQVLEMRPLNLNDVIENMGRMLTRIIGAGIDLEFKPHSPLGNVMADTGQIEQILMNLTINARDAMPDGGKLLIETEEMLVDGEYARAHNDMKPGRYVMLAVSDNGQGMTRDVMDRIFEPFFTTKEQGKGTGLGLSTVYGIVRQHNGNVWVYSEPGRGSVFKIFFPLVSAPGAAEDLTIQREKPHGTETILVVDDETYIRRLVIEVLQPLGYRVLEAAQAEEALRVSGHYAAEIHLLLADVIMPGMNGRQLADLLVANRPATKVVLMSGYTDAYLTQHGMSGPATGFIQKPLSPTRLATCIRNALDE